jgi:hypothetical protein
MQRLFRYFPILLLLASCEKETSVELGQKGPLVGADCRLKQITAVDSVTGLGGFTFLTNFDAQGIARSVEVFDSITGTMQFDAPLSWSGDTLRISDSVYYLTDANRRLQAFVAQETQGGTLVTLKYVYTYDASGYLTKKELFSSAVPLPIPLIRFSYTWSAMNLVAVDGSVVIPGFTQRLFSAVLEYDANASAKNFLPILPDAAELTPVIMAVDAGKLSRNLVRKIDVTTFNDTGAVESTATSNYAGYIYSADGYLLEWKVSGDVPEALPFPPGRNQFKYHCR